MSLIEARSLRRDFVIPKRSTFERTRRQTALAPTDLDIVEGSVSYTHLTLPTNREV